LSYSDARPWASAIRRKVITRAMPPWHADPAYGTFRNDLRLSDREIDTIVRWVDGGAREGDPATAPARPTFADGWQIGTPDVVFQMDHAFEIEARGAIEYQYFEVPTRFAEDKWIQAAEVRPGDRAHVHHVIVYVNAPGHIERPNVFSVTPVLDGRPAAPSFRPTPGGAAASAAIRARNPDAMLVNWAVGEDAPVYMPGIARRVPAGSTLTFQVHYTTNGTPGRDRSKIGLIFAKEPPRRELRTGTIANPLLAIPPGAASHPVESEATFTADTTIWSLHPHMHLRGKDMTYTAIYPDGRQEILLRVPAFDFGWQTDYWLADPIALPKGTTVRVSAHFDNSAGNRANPDPTRTVRWGDQTWEEMMIGFFTYTVEPVANQTRAQR
jgi:hypothetical protein